MVFEFFGLDNGIKKAGYFIEKYPAFK